MILLSRAVALLLASFVAGHNPQYPRRKTSG